MTSSLIFTDNNNDYEFMYSPDGMRGPQGAPVADGSFAPPMVAEQTPNSLPSRSVKKRNDFPETWLWTDTLTG